MAQFAFRIYSISSLKMDTVEQLIDNVPFGDKTLFLVDQTDGEKTLKHFKNSAKYLVMDADLLNLKRTTKKQSMDIILEECRFQLTFAMKYGKVLVVRFGNSMTDFKNTFCDEVCTTLATHDKTNPSQRLSYLPRGFMMQSGEHLKGVLQVRALYRRDDIVEMLDEEDEEVDFADVVPVCHPDFKIILTTSMPYEKLSDFHFHAKYGLPEGRSHFNVAVFDVSGDGVGTVSAVHD